MNWKYILTKQLDNGILTTPPAGPDKIARDPVNLNMTKKGQLIFLGRGIKLAQGENLYYQRTRGWEGGRNWEKFQDDFIGKGVKYELTFELV